MRYLDGVSLDAFGRGTRRMLAPVLAWAKEPVPVPEAGPKAAEGDKSAKDSPAGGPEKTRRRIGVRHLGYAAGGAFFLWPVVGGWVPTVLTTAPAVWVVAALIAGQQGDDPGAEVEGDDDQEQPQGAEATAPAQDRGTALLLHVVGALAEAEAAGRVGLHLDVVLASAIEAGLLAEGTEQGEFRAWVERAGLPTADKVGYRINGTPTTRVGLRIDAATAALGMSPAALLRARAQAPVTAPGETPVAAATGLALVPAQAVGEGPAEVPADTPAEAPVGAPAPAALRLIPGGLLAPDSAPSPALSQGQAQGAR